MPEPNVFLLVFENGIMAIRDGFAWLIETQADLVRLAVHATIRYLPHDTIGRGFPASPAVQRMIDHISEKSGKHDAFPTAQGPPSFLLPTVETGLPEFDSSNSGNVTFQAYEAPTPDNQMRMLPAGNTMFNRLNSFTSGDVGRIVLCLGVVGAVSLGGYLAAKTVPSALRRARTIPNPFSRPRGIPTAPAATHPVAEGILDRSHKQYITLGEQNISIEELGQFIVTKSTLDSEPTIAWLVEVCNDLKQEYLKKADPAMDHEFAVSMQDWVKGQIKDFANGALKDHFSSYLRRDELMKQEGFVTLVGMINQLRKDLDKKGLNSDSAKANKTALKDLEKKMYKEIGLLKDRDKGISARDMARTLHDMKLDINAKADDKLLTKYDEKYDRVCRESQVEIDGVRKELQAEIKRRDATIASLETQNAKIPRIEKLLSEQVDLNASQQMENKLVQEQLQEQYQQCRADFEVFKATQNETIKSNVKAILLDFQKEGYIFTAEKASPREETPVASMDLPDARTKVSRSIVDNQSAVAAVTKPGTTPKSTPTARKRPSSIGKEASTEATPGATTKPPAMSKESVTSQASPVKPSASSQLDVTPKTGSASEPSTPAQTPLKSKLAPPVKFAPGNATVPPSFADNSNNTSTAKDASDVHTSTKEASPDVNPASTPKTAEAQNAASPVADPSKPIVIGGSSKPDEVKHTAASGAEKKEVKESPTAITLPAVSDAATEEPAQDAPQSVGIPSAERDPAAGSSSASNAEPTVEPYDPSTAKIDTPVGSRNEASTDSEATPLAISVLTAGESEQSANDTSSLPNPPGMTQTPPTPQSSAPTVSSTGAAAASSSSAPVDQAPTTPPKRSPTTAHPSTSEYDAQATTADSPSPGVTPVGRRKIKMKARSVRRSGIVATNTVALPDTVGNDEESPRPTKIHSPPRAEIPVAPTAPPTARVTARSPARAIARSPTRATLKARLSRNIFRAMLRQNAFAQPPIQAPAVDEDAMVIVESSASTAYKFTILAPAPTPVLTFTKKPPIGDAMDDDTEDDM